MVLESAESHDKGLTIVQLSPLRSEEKSRRPSWLEKKMVLAEEGEGVDGKEALPSFRSSDAETKLDLSKSMRGYIVGCVTT